METIQKEKVLIIDDEFVGEREDVYTRVLGEHYDIIAVKNSSQLFEMIKNVDVEFYLIDIVLENWLFDANEPLEITQVLDAIKSKNQTIPILLVSSQYETLVQNGKLTRLMNVILKNKYNVLNFIVWNEFINVLKNIQYANNVLERISLELAKYRELVKIKEEKSAHVGILTAIPIEMKTFISKFSENNFINHTIGDNVFKTGSLITKNGKEIKLVLGTQNRMGMVDSAFLCAIMKSYFNISHLFMIGVCGGRGVKFTNIGDVIIPNNVFAYQNGKLTEKGFIPETTSSISNSSIQTSISEDLINMFLKQKFIDYNQGLMKDNNLSLALKAPIVRFDPLACGDQIVDKPGELDNVAQTVNARKLCGVDMESYAIHRAHDIFNGLRVSVIKSIMDLTTDKNDTYKEYAAYLAGELTFHILQQEIYEVNN